VGTRRSRLALAQTQWVIDRLRERAAGVDFRVVPIYTEGDLDRTTPLPQMGGRGVFVTAVERALLAGDVDFAVHSLKDLPTAENAQLTIAAVPVREDPRDALVSADGRSLDELPAGATVATGSLRRQAQLAARRPDLRFAPIRGNVETRRQRALAGEFDATVLAMAGLIRAQLTAGAHPLPVDVMLPAAGQGALALQCRRDDSEVAALLRLIDEPDARAGAFAERALLGLLRGGCHAPVGAYCRREGCSQEPWVLEACVARPDGQGAVRVRVTGQRPDDLAPQAYARLWEEPLVRELLTKGE